MRVHKIYAIGDPTCHEVTLVIENNKQMWIEAGDDIGEPVRILPDDNEETVALAVELSASIALSRHLFNQVQLARQRNRNLSIPVGLTNYIRNVAIHLEDEEVVR